MNYTVHGGNTADVYLVYVHGSTNPDTKTTLFLYLCTQRHGTLEHQLFKALMIFFMKNEFVVDV